MFYKSTLYVVLQMVKNNPPKKYFYDKLKVLNMPI